MAQGLLYQPNHKTKYKAISGLLKDSSDRNTLGAGSNFEVSGRSLVLKMEPFLPVCAGWALRQPPHFRKELTDSEVPVL